MRATFHYLGTAIVALGLSSPLSAGNIDYEMSLFFPVNHGETGGGAEFLEGTVFPGYIHLFGTITTDGTLGQLTTSNMVGISLFADTEFGSNGPVSDITTFTTDGPSVFFADESSLYWTKQPSSSPNAADFTLHLDTGDEYIHISALSGDGQTPFGSLLVGRGSLPEFLTELSPENLETDFFAHSFVAFANNATLFPLANAVVSEVPEPPSLMLATLAGLGLMGYGVRRRGT